MYKIGDFSKLGQVSVRMLRHYDHIDLLKPEDIDPFTGYRSYSIKQLPTLNRIVVLKESGFSLQEIKELVKGELSLESLKAIHLEKQKKIEKELKLAEIQLHRVSLRLEQIENEKKAPQYDVQEKSSKGFVIASIRTFVPHVSEMDNFCKTLHKKLYEYLEECGINEFNGELSIYHNSEYVEKDLDVEMGVKIPRKYLDKKKLPGDLKIREVEPEKRVASLIYKGPYRNTVSGVMALLNWIGLNDWQITGPIKEIQLSGPSFDKEWNVQKDPVSELQIPISE